ncbi:MAG: acyl-CoA reductase, partial [Chitinophagaceae bacterium]|nr:acyl-CoA reductase [Chitinophagaceae bacterium]
MDLQQRVVLLKKLGVFLLSEDEKWEAVKKKASHDNAWFIPRFVDYQLQHIATEFLSGENLEKWVTRYQIPQRQADPRTVGVIMAGNIPLAGFHDFLSVFISGHRQTIKSSSKDMVLIQGIVNTLIEWEPA